jgi:hypothetical protein
MNSLHTENDCAEKKFTTFVSKTNKTQYDFMRDGVSMPFMIVEIP